MEIPTALVKQKAIARMKTFEKRHLKRYTNNIEQICQAKLFALLILWPLDRVVKGVTLLKAKGK